MKQYPLEKDDTKDCIDYIKENGLHPQCERGGFCIDQFTRCPHKTFKSAGTIDYGWKRSRKLISDGNIPSMSQKVGAKPEAEKC